MPIPFLSRFEDKNGIGMENQRGCIPFGRLLKFIYRIFQDMKFYIKLSTTFEQLLLERIIFHNEQNFTLSKHLISRLK
jgi:hypothetical protein